MRKYLFVILIFTGLLAVNAQIPTPASEQTKSILILNGTAHIGNGKVIENSAVGFKDGKFTLVADATIIRIDKNGYDEVIDAAGKHIYPGFISANSTLGLTEIDAVRATHDFNDVGNIIPHVRSLVAYNTESKITATVRTNGVLLAQIAPRGGLIAGTSSVVELDGWNWEDAVLKKDDGIHVNWPGQYYLTGWWARPGDYKKNDEYLTQRTELYQFFKEAKAYNESTSKEKNLRFEAMKGIFQETKTLFISANYVKDITSAIAFVEEFTLSKVVLVGGYDAWMVADLLKKNNISVVLKRIHNLPAREDDDIDQSYKNAKLLQDKGIPFCLDMEGDMEQMNTRNLPFYAGTTVAYGLTKEEALASITFSAAKILGIDNRVGTLENEKDATLIISTGDALDMRSNNIEYAFIQGKKLDLTNHQKLLYEKYRNN